jgi:uncharacterized protein (TIGR04255 family)
MAVPRPLANPPIVEALVDIRTFVTAEATAFEAFGKEFVAEFPKPQIRRGMKAEFRVEQGKLVPPVTEDLGFQGVFLESANGTLLVQFRPDGYTLNNLRRYIGGDELLSHALRFWTMFAERFRPETVTRIALRYINRLRLPLREGDELNKFLTAAPTSPEGAPSRVSEFLSRVVAHENELPATVITTQQLSPFEPSTAPAVLVDVDSYREGVFSTDANQIRLVLDGLRELKNRTFFAHLTDEAIQLFL